MTTVAARCPSCSAPLEVVVGRKSTARSVTCSCGERFDYSCWVLKRTDDRTFTQIELFPVRVARVA